MAETTDRLLLVDDSKTARMAIRETLKHTFAHFIEASDGLTAVKAFVEEKPTFIITDLEMPNLDGFEFIAKIRGMDDGGNIPIIMISGTKYILKNKLAGFHVGASDFLLKPFNSLELTARVNTLLKTQRLMEELKEKNALLAKLAVTDELTGLYNRRHFFGEAKAQMAMGLRHGFKYACILMDIDYFKKINDTYGHAAGDEILRKISKLLTSCMREGELLARFGGEEFIICLFNTDSESALLAAERFSGVIRAHDFSSPLHPSVHITMSIGVAICLQSKPHTMDDLIKAATGSRYARRRICLDRAFLCAVRRKLPAAQRKVYGNFGRELRGQQRPLLRNLRNHPQ